MKRVTLSIVIPAYNEEINFHRGVLDQVASYLNKQSYNWEVLLVNDGSTDQTLNLLKAFSSKHPKFKIVNIHHGGKVAAVSTGIKRSSGQVTVFTDFDQSTPITETKKVLTEINKGADLVIGQRDQVKRSFLSSLRGRVFNLFVQLILLPGVTDTQCGFKGFKTSIAKELFANLKITHRSQKGAYMGAFDAEILYLARKRRYKIKPISVRWKEIRSDKLSLTEPFKMLRDVLMIRLDDLS